MGIIRQNLHLFSRPVETEPYTSWLGLLGWLDPLCPSIPMTPIADVAEYPLPSMSMLVKSKSRNSCQGKYFKIHVMYLLWLFSRLKECMWLMSWVIAANNLRLMGKLCPKVLLNALLLHHQIHYQGKWGLAPQTTIQRMDPTSCGNNNQQFLQRGLYQQQERRVGLHLIWLSRKK